MRLLFLPALLLALFPPCARAASGATAPALDAQTPVRLPGEAAAPRQQAWISLDVPVWDIADEGLPFRFTYALPSRRDPLTRLLRAEEARWTLSIGYAKVYNSYDGATGVFKNPGGHAALFSAGRQLRWRLPAVAGAATPKIVLELGAHVATRRFPADGTHANVKVITGLEWTWATRDRTAEWSAALVWPHFSNANLFSRNAGYDGLALRLGRSVRF